MKINDAVFITSVASADKFYKTDKPMIAVVGKSNVGKSSIINMLANKKKLANPVAFFLALAYNVAYMTGLSWKE